MARLNVRRPRGFSILEALFAIVLLFMAVGTFLTLLPYSLQSNQHDALYLQAVAAGQQYLDAMREAVETNQPLPNPPSILIDAGGSVVGNGANTSPGSFTITGYCTPPLNPPTDLEKCTATVQWPEAGQVRSYTIESLAERQVS